eukprot:scaffold1187_cov30-Phaeocystis_antarctica.AAC.1
MVSHTTRLYLHRCSGSDGPEQARQALAKAWLALYLESFRALLPASWADLALVSGRVLIF